MNVSVVIPVYNAAKFVSEAVSSIVNQEHLAEVILVEDGSKDESLSVCRKLEAGNPKVRLVTHPNGKNLGAGATRNLGVHRAQSDLIAFLDADDIALPNRFGLPADILAGNPETDGVYEAIGTIFEDESAKERWNALGVGDLTTVRRIVHPEELFYSLVMYDAGHFHLDGFIIRKTLFHKVGGFNESLRLHQDTDFCMKAAAVGKLVPGRLKDPVALRRVHTGNRYVKPRKDALQSRLLEWRALDEWARKTKQGRWRRLIIRYQLVRLLKSDCRGKGNYPSALFYLVMGQLMLRAISLRRKVIGAASF